MALTKISTGGVKDDAASQAKIADEAIDEARLQVSNAGSNGQFLSKQSGNTGGLTWATPPDTNTQVGGATGVDFNDDVKARFGTGNDLEIYHDGSASYIRDTGTGQLRIDSNAFEVMNAADSEYMIKAAENGAVELYYDNAKKLETTSSGCTVTGTVSDSTGNLRHIVRSVKSSAHTLVAADSGTCIYISSGGVTVNANVFGTAGHAVTIVNDSGSDQTITQGSGISIYNTADAATGNRTLAGRGMATIWFASGTTAYISGAGLS